VGAGVGIELGDDAGGAAATAAFGEGVSAGGEGCGLQLANSMNVENANQYEIPLRRNRA